MWTLIDDGEYYFVSDIWLHVYSGGGDGGGIM